MSTEHPSAYTAAFTYTNTKKTLDVQITKTVISPYAGYTVEDHSTDFGFRIYRKQPEGSFDEVTSDLAYTPYSGSETSLSYDGTNNCYKIKYGDVATLIDMSPDDEFWIVETNATGNWGASGDLDFYEYYQTVLTKIDDGTSVAGTNVTGLPNGTGTAPGKRFIIGQDGVNIDLQNEPEMKTVTVTKNTDFMEEGSLFNILVATKQHNGVDYNANLLGAFTVNPGVTGDNPTTVTSGGVSYGQYKSLKGTEITFNVPVGTQFCVNELAPDASPVTEAQRFALGSISYEYGSTPTTGTIDAGGNLVISDDTDFVVSNEIIKNNVTIQKSITNRGAGAADTDSQHTVIVRMKNNGLSDVTDYADNTVASTRITTLSYTSNMYNSVAGDRNVSNLAYNYDSDGDAVDDCHSILLKENEIITISNMPVGTYFEVYEVDVASDYSYDGTNNVTVFNQATTPARLVSVSDEHGIKFTTTNAVATVIVNNTKDASSDIKYRITYTFPSRAYTIGGNAGNARYGDLSKTVEGTLSGSDPKYGEYFDGHNITEEFVRLNTPYEKNFLVDMNWDYASALYGSTGSGEDLTYTASLSATNGGIPTKHVTFYFPYAIQRFTWSNNITESPADTSKRGHTYGPADMENPPAVTDWQSTASLEGDGSDGFGTDTFAYQGNTVVWEKHTATRTKDDGTTETYEEWSDHCTWAANSIPDGGTFAYWSIRAQDRNAEGKPYVEVARCYEQRFNYTLFDNYKVYAIYTTSPEYDSSSNGKTTDTYTYINFLEYSRNHWNGGASGSYSTVSQGAKERNLVYTDFDVSFENAYELIQSNSSTTEVGVLVEKVGTSDVMLNPDAADYATTYAGVVTANASSINTNAIKSFIAGSVSGKASNDSYDKRPIAKSNLTNKGRTEYAYALTAGLVETDGTEETNMDGVKNMLYRAYSYVRIKNAEGADTVKLCDTPVYFSIKYTAER